MKKAVLLISCIDKKGIVAAVTNFISCNNGNILDLDQHIDDQSNTFFMRLEWELETFLLPVEEIENKFKPISDMFDMKWSLFISDQLCNVAIFVSKHLHCLYDLLYKYKSGQLPCNIKMIISNHPDAKDLAEDFNISFHEFTVLKDNKIDQERAQLELLKHYNIDLIVLARYHQILTKEFVALYKNKVINIHHSFLPAFVGGKPYLQAYQKGVKIIGATSHYVTEDLDQGPIIEQDTARISHRDSVEDLIKKGEDLEKMVLNRALLWHLENRVLSYGNKTVVFK